MSDIAVEWFPRQAECTKALQRFMYVLFGGARGGGKSHYSRTYLIVRASKYANTRHLLVRKSFPELQRNHISRMLTDYPQLEYNQQHHEFRFPNGSIIECGYCESERDLQRWQGAEFATIALDEAQFHDRAIFNFFKTILRTSSMSGIKPRMLLTGNPGGYAWVKQTFIDGVHEHDERVEDFAFVRSLVTDNPALMKADPEYIERLRSLPPALRAAFLEGDWNAVIGAFFDVPADMEEEPFEIAESDAARRLYASVDHGIRHSTACGLDYLDERGHIHRLFTYMGTGFDAATHAAEFCDRIRAFPHTKGVAPFKLFYDPSMRSEARIGQLVASPLTEYERVFRDNNMGKTLFVPANNSRVFGSQLLQQYLRGRGVPQLRVWRPYNREARALLGQIMCDPNNAEVYLKEETPADDFCFGAGTLISTDAGSVPIETISIGDQVLTRRGLRRVTATAVREADTIRWGPTVVTPGHRVITQRGKIPVCELTRQDTILSIDIAKKHIAVDCVRQKRQRRQNGRALVYNITVDGEHEYFADGILVANCDGLRYSCVGIHGESMLSKDAEAVKAKMRSRTREVAQDWYTQ